VNLRRRPGILFFVVAVPVLAAGSLFRRFVFPVESFDFLIVSALAFCLAVLLTYFLYDPSEAA